MKIPTDVQAIIRNTKLDPVVIVTPHTVYMVDELFLTLRRWAKPEFKTGSSCADGVLLRAVNVASTAL